MSGPYDAGVTRRDAVTRLAAAGLAAGAVGGGALFFHDRRRAEASSPPIPDWRVPASDQYPPAASAGGPDAAVNVRRAVAALGGMGRFVRPGESVLIKPNVGWDRIPEQAANTDPEVVAELVRLCRTAGARRVVVTDISCNDPRRCFTRSGITAAASGAGAEVIESHRLVMVPAALTGLAAGIEVVEELFKADRVINVPVVKHHSLSRVTLGMKNWYGVLGTGRNRLHQSIDRSIAELGAAFRPTLTVMDATRILLRNGPQGGSLNDVRAANAVAAGTDPVLCDAWGAAQLGHAPSSLPFIELAQQRALGRADLKAVRQA